MDLGSRYTGSLGFGSHYLHYINVKLPHFPSYVNKYTFLHRNATFDSNPIMINVSFCVSGTVKLPDLFWSRHFQYVPFYVLEVL